MCQQFNIVNQIGCNSMQLPTVDGYPLCRNMTMYLLATLVTFNLSLCDDLCPIECNIVTYETSVSYSTWPTYNSYEWALANGILDSFFDKNNVTYDIASKSVASALISYKEIKYTEISESPSMTFVDLVAAVGGMLGLFLGFSLMVPIELIEFCILFFLILFKKN